MMQIGYADFIRAFNVRDPLDWVPGLEVRTDGIWVVPPRSDYDCVPEERATLAEHPENDLSKPALPFPCDYKKLEKFLSLLGMPLEVFVGEKWWPGHDVLNEYGLQEFQLFELLQEGVRARTITGLEVVNEDRLERRCKKSFEDLKKIELLKEGAAQTGVVITDHGFAGNRPPKRSDYEIRKAAQTAFEKQPRDVLVIPDGCEAISYSLSYGDNRKRSAAITRAVGFLFKSVDVIKYMWAINMKPLESSPAPAQQEQSQQAADIVMPAEKHRGHDIPQVKKEPALSFDDYIKKRRAEQIDSRVIAVELCDEDGPFKLSHAHCAKILKIGDCSINISHDAWKKRGRRAVEDGKEIMQRQRKTSP